MEIGTLGKFPCMYMEKCLYDMGVSQLKMVQIFNSHGSQGVTAVACYAVCRLGVQFLPIIWHLNFHQYMRIWKSGHGNYLHTQMKMLPCIDESFYRSESQFPFLTVRIHTI
jgi:hypothetical protein